MQAVLQAIYDNVISGKKVEVQKRVKEALETNLPPGEILNLGMVSAMAEVGARFERGDFFIPEMLMAARGMQAGLEILKPHLMAEDVPSAGKAVIGTVKGDLHDIGKNLVGIMLEGAGFQVVDLGTDVAPEQFAAAVQEHKPQIVGLSALLTTTMANMATTIVALEDSNVRETVSVIVGGAPVTEDFSKKIGADGFAPDASRAVGLAKRLVQEQRRLGAKLAF
jgi:5-methyltetrahydrofolate--homocysteine methyltransferase